MGSLIVDERDQRFVLHEMLDVEQLCTEERFADFTREMYDMVCTEARKLAEEEIFPTLEEADRVGCRLEDGQVYVPECFRRPYQLYCEGGWNSMCFPPEVGGQGMPTTLRTAAHDWFGHNFSFMSYPGLAEGAAHLVLSFGTPEQKQRYLPGMVSGEYGGTMCLTEPGAGSDVGALSTRATRMEDGTYRIKGTKMFITSGDSDLTANIIHPVLARIEGDPPGTAGISIFLVPKYLPSSNGGPKLRNDLEIAGIEEKLGIHGSSTCLINFGDNDSCYAELLGEERGGMKVMFQMMNEARISVGMQGLAAASAAYLHSVNYARERLQGSSLRDFKNPEAPRVPIIKHPDVRRMLLWMKANVDAMRGLMYFTSYAVDRSLSGPEEERQRWEGFIELLTPICKAYCSDVGFRITETAIQVYGGYGFCKEYPVQQFMRDEKIASIYEGANGIQALDLVGRKLPMKKGLFFMNLLTEMNATITRYQDTLGDLCADLQQAVNTLAEVSMFFAGCGKEGKFLVPVSHAYPFLMMMGKVVSAWMLLWQAGVAREKLAARGADESDRAAWKQLMKDHHDAAFYAGKIASARYFMRNILPEVQAAATSIKTEDLSIMEIPEQSFASV